MGKKDVRRHTFYEIVGRRVGCSVTDHKALTKRYEAAGEPRPVEILFELVCDNQTAGDVEWSLADLFGYQRGPHYTHLVCEGVA
jgi:hypothetical protein